MIPLGKTTQRASGWALVSTALSVVVLASSIGAPLCLCRCAHPSAQASTMSSCGRHAAAPARASHPCEHACARLETTAVTAGPVVSPEASSSPVVVLAAGADLFPGVSPARAQGGLERDVGPPGSASLHRILRL